MSDLHDWRDRLDQADERLDEVEALISAFIASNPYGVVTQINPIGNHQAVLTAKMTEKQHVPRRVSVVLAEIFGHMRSSLDHLMCALAGETETATAPTGTQFPVFKDRDVYRAKDKAGHPKKGSGRWQMRGVAPRVQAIIQGVQPYKRGAQAVDDPLWLTHAFSAIDKHRKPHVTGAILQSAGLSIGQLWGVDMCDDVGVRMGAFKKGTEITRMTFTITNPANYKVTMHHDLTYDVAFDPKGPGAGRIVVPTVRGLIAHVRDEVIPKLEPFV